MKNTSKNAEKYAAIWTEFSILGKCQGDLMLLLLSRTLPFRTILEVADPDLVIYQILIDYSQGLLRLPQRVDEPGVLDGLLYVDHISASLDRGVT
jgi:hypothetical protein